MEIDRAERTLAFRIDEQLYREIKIKLAEEGITLKSYVLGLIDKDLHEKPHKTVDYTSLSRITNQLNCDIDTLTDIVNAAL